MPTPSDAVRSAPGPPTALRATRPSRHQPRLQARQKTEVVVAATVAAILLLLLAFVLWPVLRVLATSLAGPAGLTLANYAEVVSSWRLLRILVNSLVVSTVSTVVTGAVARGLAYCVAWPHLPGNCFG